MLGLLTTPAQSASPCSNNCQKEFDTCVSDCPKAGGCRQMCKILQKHCGQLCYVNQRPAFGA